MHIGTVLNLNVLIRRLVHLVENWAHLVFLKNIFSSAQSVPCKVFVVIFSALAFDKLFTFSFS